MQEKESFGSLFRYLEHEMKLEGYDLFIYLDLPLNVRVIIQQLMLDDGIIPLDLEAVSIIDQRETFKTISPAESKKIRRKYRKIRRSIGRKKYSNVVRWWIHDREVIMHYAVRARKIINDHAKATTT